MPVTTATENEERPANSSPARMPRGLAEPRQKRAERTRAALLAMAERLAVAEGEEAVTTSRVAAECGVAVGTIYRYFADRDALLLAAYDATVGRIVERCRAAMATLDPGLTAADAARAVLAAYLDAAEAIPAHAPLLRAMRRIRSVEQDSGDNRDRIASDLLTPFLSRYSKAEPDPLALSVTNTVLSALVDLTLLAEGEVARGRLRAELEAHMLLALERLTASRRNG